MLTTKPLSSWPRRLKPCFLFGCSSIGFYLLIIGLLGIFNYLLGHVEGWFYKSRPFESLDRVDIMVADWMRSGAPRIFEQLNNKYFTNQAAQEKFLAVRARCLQSDIFQVFDRLDTQRKGFLDREEFQNFMLDLDIVLTDVILIGNWCGAIYDGCLLRMD